MKIVLIFIFLTLVWGCEKQYTGKLTKDEYDAIVRAAEKCVSGGSVVRMKMKDGKGEILANEEKTSMVSISFSAKGFPTVMFGLNSREDRIRCLKNLFGGNWEKVSSAFLIGGVVFTEIARVPAECLPGKRGYGFYCNIKYSMFWGKELGEIKSGVCAEFYSYLAANGVKTINCFEVH